MSRVLAVSGSLRRASFNSLLLRALPELAPEGMKVEIFSGLGAVPMYNEDIDTNPAHPAIACLREAVHACDGIVIATPEYNHSIPGAVKNAIDWLSRPHGLGALSGKAIMVLTATLLTRAKGIRAIADATRILSGLGNLVLTEPEIVVPNAAGVLRERSDGTVALCDEVAAGLIRIQLAALHEVIQQGLAPALLEVSRRERTEMTRLQFLPYLRDALDAGADTEQLARRMVGSGFPAEMVTEWIRRARPGGAAAVAGMQPSTADVG
ncbi:MAG: NADPH-dependent FMN reductase [Pseudonocardiaceae bacterium]